MKRTDLGMCSRGANGYFYVFLVTWREMENSWDFSTTSVVNHGTKPLKCSRWTTLSLCTPRNGTEVCSGSCSLLLKGLRSQFLKIRAYLDFPYSCPATLFFTYHTSRRGNGHEIWQCLFTRGSAVGWIVKLAQIPGCYPLSKFCSTAVSRCYSGQLFTGACIPYNYELHQS